jgi:DNA-directed RNA polymerase subunit K/omega
MSFSGDYNDDFDDDGYDDGINGEEEEKEEEEENEENEENEEEEKEKEERNDATNTNVMNLKKSQSKLRTVRTTFPILNITEKTKVVGERANALNNGAKPLIDLDKYPIIKRKFDPVDIAIAELNELKNAQSRYGLNKIPPKISKNLIDMMITRTFPDKSYEEWSIQELKIM